MDKSFHKVAQLGWPWSAFCGRSRSINSSRPGCVKTFFLTSLSWCLHVGPSLHFDSELAPVQVFGVLYDETRALRAPCQMCAHAHAARVTCVTVLCPCVARIHPRPRLKRKVFHTNPDPKRDGNRSGRTDELRYLPHFSSSCLPGSPGSLDLLHRIRGFQRLRIQRIYSSNSLCLFHPFVFFSLCVRCTAHCHQQCVSAHVANSASHISSYRLFSRGHDPFAHACEARPLTIVGWISLSVSLSLSSPLT